MCFIHKWGILSGNREQCSKCGLIKEWADLECYSMESYNKMEQDWNKEDWSITKFIKSLK